MPSVITPIIDTAIGIVVVYIAFSLLTSWVGEQISSFMKKRARMLVGALVQLLSATPGSAAAASARGTTSDSVTSPKVAVDFFAHPIFLALRKSAADDPQYLSAQQFSSILLGLIQPPAPPAPPPPVPVTAQPAQPPPGPAPATAALTTAPVGAATTVTATTAGTATPATTTTATTTTAPPFDFSAIIAKAASYGLGDQISALAARADGNFGAFVKAVEDWYDDHMDRVSGWYVKHAQNVLVAIGLVLAIIWNVDSLRLARAFSCNAGLRTSISEMNVGTKEAPNSAFIRSVIDAVPLGWVTNGPVNSPPERSLSCDAIAEKVAAAPPAAVAAAAAAKKADDDKVAADRKSSEAHKASTSAADFAKRHPKDKGAATRATNAQKAAQTALAATGPAATKAAEAKAAAEKAATPAPVVFNDWNDWFWWGLLKLVGLLVTAVALSQGAGFWFDTLSKLTRVRNAGKKPDTSPDASRA
ncbi:MAG: hypothetical protein M3169_05935 [Candidatus Eremiobacteraeota bacterium]|nr:hypothetical protein [Candidatus Eremiobacteraeota bacterium]